MKKTKNWKVFRPPGFYAKQFPRKLLNHQRYKRMCRRRKPLHTLRMADGRMYRGTP